MAEEFLHLSAADQRDALGVASGASGRPVHLLEKDVWVVWALEKMFASKYGPQLIFKGGTSLSKAYGAIRRFSEDIDLTYDIRAIAPDLVAGIADALPPTKSQGKKWSGEIKDRLSTWVERDALPIIGSAISLASLRAHPHIKGDKLYIDYEPLARGTGYVPPIVVLEFGARSTGEPHEVRGVVCDAAAHLPELTFPSAHPQVMRVERTFWEKATAMHVFCRKGYYRGEDAKGFSRHWHDVVRLDESGYAERAIADRNIAQKVAEHKAVFFAERDAAGSTIDYEYAVNGGIRLVPEGDALKVLAEDYRAMVGDGLLFVDTESFEALIERCRQIEQRANSVRKTQK
ncbi:MAG TPA: nucleotidyl transferase AbiEii/AbiGii toxin family protein [Terracidiphilus sp.]|nr:nucleotidyl transferase AbiEii/AbiGii toxin family protein [Terracidiphilus sp.]